MKEKKIKILSEDEDKITYQSHIIETEDVREIIDPIEYDGDDYAHPDSDFRAIPKFEIEPQNGPDGICEQEIDSVSVRKIGKLNSLFQKLPSDDVEILKKEIEEWKKKK